MFEGNTIRPVGHQPDDPDIAEAKSSLLWAGHRRSRSNSRTTSGNSVFS